MAIFKVVYRGSRSMRAGMIWLVLVIFWVAGVDTVIDLRTGVERWTDGRLLRAAGSISGMSGCGLRGRPSQGRQRDRAIWARVARRGEVSAMA